MTKCKLLIACLSLAFALLCVPASYGQAVPIVAVGSSAIFPSAAIAAVNGDPILGGGPLCGKNLWTGTASGTDARGGAIPLESATTWIAWDGATDGSTATKVCVYVSTDSIIGQRLFFGQGPAGNATLFIPVAACTTVGGNKIAFLWDTPAPAPAPLPLAIYNVLMGNVGHAACDAPTAPKHFNVAFTDVRAEDAKFIGQDRVLAPDGFPTAFFPPDDKGGMGYGPFPGPGFPVMSSYSTALSNNVGYNITGTDPINTTLAIPTFQEIGVGVVPIVPFVNITNAAPGSAGFGDLILTKGLNNVNSHTLSALYTGQIFATRDILGGNASLGLPVTFVHALEREPQSGTYTTFEWQVIRQRDGFNANSQETGNCGPSQGPGCPYLAPPNPSCAGIPAATPAVLATKAACSNPVNFCIGANCALRSRVIGTGQMLTIGNAAAGSGDTLGYAFWSLGTFGNKLNVKYLQLDGTDPLFPSYAVHSGVFPGGVVNQGTVAILAAPAPGQCGGYFNGDGGATITSFSCNAYALPTFDAIQAGSYRAWTTVNATYYAPAPIAPAFGAALNVTGFILGAQDQAAPAPVAVIPDFLPVQYCTPGGGAGCPTTVKPLNVFRSHYSIGGFVPNNGIQPGAVEAGGSVAGAVHNVQSELDTGLIGGTFLTWIQ